VTRPDVDASDDLQRGGSMAEQEVLREVSRKNMMGLETVSILMVKAIDDDIGDDDP